MESNGMNNTIFPQFCLSKEDKVRQLQFPAEYWSPCWNTSRDTHNRFQRQTSLHVPEGTTQAEPRSLCVKVMSHLNDSQAAPQSPCIRWQEGKSVEWFLIKSPGSLCSRKHLGFPGRSKFALLRDKDSSGPPIWDQYSWWQETLVTVCNPAGTSRIPGIKKTRAEIAVGTLLPFRKLTEPSAQGLSTSGSDAVSQEAARWALCSPYSGACPYYELTLKDPAPLFTLPKAL